MALVKNSPYHFSERLPVPETGDDIERLSLDLFFSCFSKKFSAHGFLTEQFTERDQPQSNACNPAERGQNISAILRLRMLMGQGAVASDDGFTALSRSQTIEYIWGRECPNLGGRGFTALAAMPALSGLAVSRKNVDDTALSALPSFPALRALMQMDVPDEGFRHVGRCERLEEPWLVYCRDTGDAATERIAACPG